MESITLGKTGIEVTILGLGTWAWGDKLFWNYGSQYGISDLQAAFSAAVETGITFFDTAEVYGLGESERLLGNFIKKTEKPVQIATKYGPVPWRYLSNSVEAALNASLKRLQVEQIMLYQVHWPFTFFMTQEKLINALADAVQSGKIKSIGISNYSAAQMIEVQAILSKRDIPLATNQVQYSLLHRKIESNGIWETAQDLGITILAYSPLAQGLLTGKYTPEMSYQPDGARKFDARFSPRGLTKITRVLELLFMLAQKYQKTPAQIALNWLISQNNVIPIPGVKNAQQVRENAGAAMWRWRLSLEDVNQLELVTRPWL
ncbi:aldo/keto reductase [Gloeocapsa sp. PCC 73106]|uniref:aldo/keto reductase n=1 Tax=Gloeocapsa sp. PCC 73106 TaxID=102232 RepID=UPI0002ABBEB4|nr:aldo/keto reductase [Gloeocapsa sp. PCC 73106]ELR96319.1 putative oxidoreductase, aryl-alcohol dehydrogenase like protein [Gloeocapsa sp. PCC 73106]